jgi:glycosyltransferase involved in cell wall biosynthesis
MTTSPSSSSVQRPRDTIVAMSPRVSVIIATYNWSSVLPYSIGSVLRQTMTDFEVLVVGDGCTDDSEQVVAAIGDPRVRWINLPANTKHQSGPNNEGLRQARGEFIAYLGHDDLWLPQHLALMVSALDATASDLAHSLNINVSPGESSGWLSVPNAREGHFASPLCIVHRKRMTEEIGGWRDYREINGGPDVELWRRAHAAGYRFTFVRRLTGIKLPAGWRRDVYQMRPCSEQAAWFARIESEPDFEVELLVSMIVEGHAPTAVPYRVLLRQLADETMGRIRRRWSQRSFLGFRARRTIDEIRRFKGLGE